VIRHAHRTGVKVLFDQPLLPGFRSAEVIHHPERFVKEGRIVSPDGTQTWPFACYDWEYEHARGYEDYLAPFSYFIDELGFDGFRWDAFHTILLAGQEELLRRMASRFNGKRILRLGEQLGADEEEVNPLLRRYGYFLYLVPWWCPEGGVADTVEKLEERIIRADGGNWWLASSLHDHPRITEWYAPLAAQYGRLPQHHKAALARAILSLFAFFPNFIIFYGDEYAARQRINTPGDAMNTWDAPPPWAEELGNPDLTAFVATLNRVREQYPELRSAGGRMILDNDAKARGVSSLALVAGNACFVLIASFSPRRARSWVKVPFEALGVDPARPFALRDLLTGREMKFLPGESVSKDEGAIMVSLHFGDVILFRAGTPGCGKITIHP
jgi:4-alpha-glucanotransferase